ncbi:hypothetical protein EJB05_35101, partial [Eragrostis curvula]
MRALRVAMEGYHGKDAAALDQSVCYAVQQAGPALDVDLRLCYRLQICNRAYGQPIQHYNQGVQGFPPLPYLDSDDALMRPVSDTGSDNGSFVTSDDEKEAARDCDYWPCMPGVYMVPRVLFNCAALRSLSLSSCLLAPPATVRLPSLETLLLSRVHDGESEVQRFIAGCPHLADLTLEACETVTALSVLGGTRLRRLALRCCHGLASVAVDASELRAFEYRGAVPDTSLLTLHGGTQKIKYCKVDICGPEVTSMEELINLRELLQLFANAEHLHLESARLGSGIDEDVSVTFPSWPRLRHLELRGRLPDDDTAIVASVSSILEHTPNLEELSLAFHPEKHEGVRPVGSHFMEVDLLDAHYLRYNPHNVLTVRSVLIPCLRSRVREINLVHYQGGKAQRALAKFLLCNAPAVEELWCDFAEGPLWIQTELMREIKGWVVNKSANTHFS